MSGNDAHRPDQVGRQDCGHLHGQRHAGLFRADEDPLLSGRVFTADDTRGSVPVVIVNDQFARRIRPDGRVVGQIIAVGNPDGRRILRSIGRSSA
jgi:hypothetical protein